MRYQGLCRSARRRQSPRALWARSPGTEPKVSANALAKASTRRVPPPPIARLFARPREVGGLLKPGVYCFHDSCRGAVEAASLRLGVRSASALPGQPWQYFPPRPRCAQTRSLPSSIPAKLKKIAARLDGIDAAWLAARSPIRPDNRTPASFLHSLYRPGEKVLIFDVFTSQGQGLWTHDGRPTTPASLTVSAWGSRAESGSWSTPSMASFSLTTMATSQSAQRQTSPPGDTF